MIPRFQPWLGWPELKALFQRNRGAVERFEQEFALAFEAEEAVAFPYGRSALWAFFKALGIRDSEVVMPAYSCSVVAHAISLSGNRPRFVDIRLYDYNMDLDQLPAAINQDTRAIVATHLFGYPLDLDRLEAIRADAEARFGHKIWLIQDCAHSFGAKWNGRLVGTCGDVALYGLNISKMITSIFGGLLTFQDPALASQVRAWRDAHFRKPSWSKGLSRRLYLLAVYVAFHERIYGFTWWLQEKTDLLNSFTKSYHRDDKVHFPPDHLDTMLDVEAGVGLAQLPKYKEIVAQRCANAHKYDQYLPRVDGWILPALVEGATYSHYVVRVADRIGTISAVSREGIQLGQLIEYSIPELSDYRGQGEMCRPYPVAGTAAESTVNLPLTVSREAAEQVLAAVRRSVNG